MSTLRTNNLQNPDSSNVNIELTQGSGAVVAGVTTFSSDVRVSGNLNVDGIVTYDDVTNIDAVGIITAQSGVHIDDSITHLGDTNTKIRFPAADTITAETGGTERLRITSAGKVMMGKSSSSINRNLSITGVTGNSNDAEIGLQPTNSSGGINPEAIIGATADGAYGAHMFFTTRDTSGNRIERLRVSSAGKVGIGTDNPKTKLHVQQSAVSSAPNRLAALYLENNANCEIQFVGNSSNDCQLRFGTSSNSFKGAVEYELDNNNLKFYTNGTERLRITSDGKVRVPDNGKFVAGASDDLQIYHDGNNSFIENAGVGSLNLYGDEVNILNKARSEYKAKFITDGAVELYYNNSKKFETTSTGVSVTGSLAVNGNNYPTAGPLSNRNLIINGAHIVWQRQTSVAGGTLSAFQWAADRFWLYAPSSSSGTIGQSTDAPSGFAYSTHNNLNATCNMGTNVELLRTGADAPFVNGESLTLSFYIKSTSNRSNVPVVISTRDNAGGGGSVDRASGVTFNSTTSWTRVEKTFTLSGTIGGNNKMLQFEFTLAIGDRVTGFQLEKGTKATPFEHRSFRDELAKCQRYYRQNGRIYGIWTSASAMRFIQVLSPKMRVPPTTTVINTNGYHEKWNLYGYSGISNIPGVYGDSKAQDFQLNSSQNRTRSYGEPALLGPDVISFSAEL